MNQIEFPNSPVVIQSGPALPEEVHVFDEQQIWALNAALAAKRPLLVRGEPGVGKTQLARAAAVILKRPLIPHVVDSRTESRDLLWTFDAIQRLADAQLTGALGDSTESSRERLAVENYLEPGPLWWAFDWNDAREHARQNRSHPDGWRPGQGCVVLLDEIDKAESDVPNGLLEALGAGRFQPPGREHTVQIQGETPLVVITTNEERVLPDAFVRRCLVLHLALPETRQALRDLLVSRGKAHFENAEENLLSQAAEILIQDRETARAEQLTPLPGQAEYLDLVRAVLEIAPSDPDAQREALSHIQRFILKKNVGSQP